MRVLPRVGDGGGTGPGFGIRPGLAAGGLGVDWREWYRGRIATWTGGDSALEGPSAAEELTRLDSGRLDHFETLPAYWLC